MIRFVIRRKLRDRMSGLEREEMETIDCDVPDLERALLGGGTDIDSYDYRSLAGAEVLPPADPVVAAAPVLLAACRSAIVALKGREHDGFLRDAIEAATGVRP